MNRLFLLPLVAIGAPALADPLQDQLLAGMRATRTGDVAFTMTTHIDNTVNGTHDNVMRFDGRGGWTILSTDGKPPTAKQVAKAAKRTSPASSYAELAKWFGSPATRTTGPGGATVYHFARLPAGEIKMGSHDASGECQADAEVATAGGRPYVARVRFTSTAPFRMMLVAKVEAFAINSVYAPLADGRLFPAGIDTHFAGSMMGKSGTLTSHTRFTDAHATR